MPSLKCCDQGINSCNDSQHTTPLPYLWKMHSPLRISYFVLSIIVNDDLECKCRWLSLNTISFCVSFFWKLPESYGLELIHIPIVIKHSFDFPLFPLSLYHWLSYISQIRNDEKCRLGTNAKNATWKKYNFYHYPLSFKQLKGLLIFHKWKGKIKMQLLQLGCIINKGY